jgi:hypothetical protein
MKRNVEIEYSLEYYVNNKLKETIMISKAYPLVLWKKNNLKQTTHKMGTFKIKKR